MQKLTLKDLFSILISTILFHFILINLISAQEIRVMTFNIKYDNKTDTINNWEFRKEGLTNLIYHYQPDILGIQEGLLNQVSYIDSSLNNYSYIGVGRDDGKTTGEFSAIFYNHNLLSVIRDSTFWLSDSPDSITVGWDAALERICTYGLFKCESTGQLFWVFNTHFDHMGQIAREKSAELILGKIKSLNENDYPVILSGDFNAQPNEEPIRIILSELDDAAVLSKSPPYGPKGTFNGFTENIINNRIDYIFVKDYDVIDYIHIDDRLDNNKHISDHLPVMATLIFNF